MEEYSDSHVVLDLADIKSLEGTSYKLMMDLQELVEESDYRFVLCGRPPISSGKCSVCVISDEFDTFDTRLAAITELTPLDVY